MGLFIAMIGGPAMAASPKKLQFSPSDPASLILMEERADMHGGLVTFARVDLERMIRFDESFILSKAMDMRLRTSNPGLTTKGEGLMIPKNMSRFSVEKAPAGDYALVRFSAWHYACVEDGAPVYRFKPGVANLISAEMLPSGGGSPTFFKFSQARNDSNNDIADAQEILNEYKNLTSEVVYAQLLGFASFTDKKGRISGCNEGMTIGLFKPVPIDADQILMPIP